MADETTRREYVEEYVEVAPAPDPVANWLKFGILFLAVTALTAVLYALLVGVINPSSPRTAVEARLVVLRNAATSIPESGKARRDYIDALIVSGDMSEAKAQHAKAKKEIKETFEIAYVDLAELDILWAEKKYPEVVTKTTAMVKAEQKRRDDFYKERKKSKNIEGIEVPVAPMVQMLTYQARANGAQEKWTEAVKSLNAALKLDPLAADLLILRADAYIEAGQKDKAKKDFEKALEYIPDFAPALAGLEALEKDSQ